MRIKRFWAVLLWFLASTAGADICPNKIRVQLDLAAPTSYLDAQGAIAGMDVEMLQLILREAGCEIEWTFESMSIERALRQIQGGDVDVITRMSNRPERRRYAHFSEVYRQEVLGLYALKETPLPEFSTLAEAYEKGVRLIAPGAGFFGEELQQVRERWLASGRMTAYDSATYASRLLFTKPRRGDMILIDADVFHHFISDTETEQVVNVGDWLLISPTHIMFSKKTISAELVERINTVIREHRNRGTLAAIERRYRPALLMQNIERLQAASAAKSAH